jgi:predicted dehydrogenase
LKLRTDAPPPGMEDVRELSFAVDQAESIRRAIDAFAHSIMLGVRPQVSGEDGRAALELSLACYRSAASGMPERLPERSTR